jgi:hypothetical protein
MVFALLVRKNSAAFVYRARGQHIATKRLARATRILFAIPQIA